MIEIERNRFSTVDEYLDAQPDSVKATLEQLRQIIKKAAPDAEELMSY